MAGWWNLMLEVWRIDYMHKLGRMATTVILPLIIMIIVIVIIIIVTWRFQFKCFVKDKTELAQRVTWSSCNFGFPTQTWLLKNGGEGQWRRRCCSVFPGERLKEVLPTCLWCRQEKKPPRVCVVYPPSYLPPDYTTELGWKNWPESEKEHSKKYPK